MTLQEMLDRVDDLYPNGETVRTKVHYMNMALDSLYPEFGKIKTDESIYTIQGQDEYNFPSDITNINQILDVSIGNRAVPKNRHDYIQYALGYEDENPMVGRTFYQVYDSDGNISLAFYPIPPTTGLPIRIKYHKRFAGLDYTELTSEPELREEYQMLLVFYAVHMIAASGPSPDGVQADTFMQKFDVLLMSMWKDRMTMQAEYPPERKDNITWRRY